MKIYRGDRTIDGIVVLVNEEDLEPRIDAKCYSSDGFEWGYEGPAPSQLAFAILLDHFGDVEKAASLHEIFMKRAVANFHNEWEMNSDDVDHILKD